MPGPTKSDYENELTKLDDAGVDPKVINAFNMKVAACFESDRDGRGVRRCAVRTAHLACRRLRRAWIHQSTHPDQAVRHEARKIITSVCHPGDLNALAQRLSRLTGLMNRSAQREKTRRRAAAERTITLSDGHQLQEVLTLPRLVAIGRALEICVAREREARDYLNRPDAEYWVLIKADGRPWCLLEVDTSDGRTIEQCNERDNQVPQLGRELAFEISRALKASGDENPAFADVGAFTAFLNGTPEVDPIEIDGRLHWIWNIDDYGAIIIAREEERDRKSWVQFLVRDGEIAPVSGVRFGFRRRFGRRRDEQMSEGRLFYLALRHPALLKKLLVPIPLPRKSTVDSRCPADAGIS